MCSNRILSAGSPGNDERKEGPISGAFWRADDGARTRDPQLGKLMLYQLSYVRAAAHSSEANQSLHLR